MMLYFEIAPRRRVAVVSGLLMGSFFGAVMAIAFGVSCGWLAGITFGLIAGVLFGAIMGFFIAAFTSAARGDYQGLTRDQMRQANRAVVGRGGIPDDPLVRHAALRRAHRTHRQIKNASRFSTPVFAVVLVVNIVIAVLDRSPQTLFVAIVWAGLLAQQVLGPRIWARRVARLSGSAPG